MTGDEQFDEIERAFCDWVESTPRGEFPNCETNVAEACVVLDSFTAGFEAAKRMYTK